jgi:hypothetical protein
MKILTSLLTIFFFLIFSLEAKAQTSWTDKFTLQAGLSFNMVEIRTDKFIDNRESKPDDPEEETRTLGLGGVTSIHYHVGNWEFGVASDFVFGKFKDVTFIYNTNSIRGEGSFRLISLGPQVKYYTPYTLFNMVSFYLGAGPSWSLQTFVFGTAATTGNFTNKRRVSFENIGGGLYLGIEQILPSKADHPLFLEIGYNYMHSYKVSILDASDTADVITLSEGDSNEFSAQYIIVRLGAALF